MQTKGGGKHDILWDGLPLTQRTNCSSAKRGEAL
jgi:hypothetical protein